MEILSFLVLLVSAVYGCYIVVSLARKAWQRIKPQSEKTSPIAVLVAALLVIMLLPGAGAHAQSASISLDMTPFFTSLNSYLPTFVGIFGLVGGIAAALGFARFIVNVVVKAVSDGSF